jgi:hypothetical protein
MTFDEGQTHPLARQDDHKDENVNVQTKIQSLTPDRAELPFCLSSRYLCLWLASCFFLALAYSSTLKMETVPSSETSVKFNQTRRCYIQEDNVLYRF